jgi:hypothetical protein
MADITTAVHWWLCENCTKNKDVFARIRSLLGHFFGCANSLHIILAESPLPHVEGYNAGIRSSGKYSVYIINQLSPRDFFHVRGILALVGDIADIVKKIKQLSYKLDNDKLSSLLELHLPNMKKYRYARNYFAHFDERISGKMKRHGVTGELEVPELGIKFTESAEACFYLGFVGDTLYYHDRQKDELKPSPKTLCLHKRDVSDIFDLVKDLYNLLTSHTMHAESYPPSNIYDLD